MSSVAAVASKQRPSTLSQWLDGSRQRRMRVVAAALLGSVVAAFFFGFRWGDERLLQVNGNLYVATAALFVVALAIERLTELLIAPWVGGGDRRLDRNILVGSFSLLVATVVSGFLGLRILALFRGGGIDGSGWVWEQFAPSIDIFATGLAIGAGSKPLHDLISRFEKSAAEKRRAARAESEPSAAIESEPDKQEVDVSGGVTHRLVLALPDDADAETVANVLPGWRTVIQRGERLAYMSTSASPGTPQYVNDAFSALYRLASMNIKARPLLPVEAPAGTPEVVRHRRWSLELMRVTRELQESVAGADGIRVAMMDTGVTQHPHSVDEERVDRVAGHDVLDPACSMAVTIQGAGAVDGDQGRDAAPEHAVFNRECDPIDPLIDEADYFDLDLLGSAGHGTGTAALVAAGGSAEHDRYSQAWWEKSPMIGVAPQATVVPYRVMRGPVHLFDDDVAKGVAFARRTNCDVISMSLGGFCFRNLREQVDAAIDEGLVVLCAAGNEFGVVVEPANYPTMIANASVKVDAEPYLEGSSRGPEITISAPGVDVWRPDFGKGGAGDPVLEPGIGTTYATAHTAGVAALWLKKHDPAILRTAYPGRKLQQLFMYVLKATARPWADPTLGIDWGAGIVDAEAVLAYPILDEGTPTVADEELDAMFRQETLTASDRIAGGVAAVLTADGTLQTRYNLAVGLGKLGSALQPVFDTAGSWVRRLFRRGAPAPPVADPESTATTVRLMSAELREHRRADPQFMRALVESNGGEIPIPAGATDELRCVLDEHHNAPPGEVGQNFSAGLRKAFRGEARVQHGYRWIGVVALGLAVVVAIVWVRRCGAVDSVDAGGDGGNTPNPGFSDFSSLAGAVGLIGIGVYGAAQGIERLLEFTIGRWAFRDVPGREADRALILLGAGVLLGTLASLVLRFGILRDVSDPTAWRGDDPFGWADAMITGLAIGGGAKPVHDLLTWIRPGVGTEQPKTT